MNYENKILDAIETVVNNAVSNAGYDRTIQAKIISCIDPTIGKYKVQYQDSTFLHILEVLKLSIPTDQRFIF